MAFCMHCGGQIEDKSTFCNHCGKKQVVTYTQTFRRGDMTEEQFIQSINQWFAQYPHVANVKGEFLTHHGVGLFVNKYVLDAFAIEYELLSGNNTKQYAVVNLDRAGLYNKSTDALLENWKQANPGAIILKRSGGVNQRGSTGSLLIGGLGAVNHTQLYLFFKFDRKYGPGVLPPGK